MTSMLYACGCGRRFVVHGTRRKVPPCPDCGSTTAPGEPLEPVALKPAPAPAPASKPKPAATPPRSQSTFPGLTVSGANVMGAKNGKVR